MNDAVAGALAASIREQGEQAILDGDIQRAEMDAALAAAAQGDMREARGFFLLLLTRMTERQGGY